MGNRKENGNYYLGFRDPKQISVIVGFLEQCKLAGKVARLGFEGVGARCDAGPTGILQNLSPEEGPQPTAVV